jgi:diaminopimelate epimerase
METARAAEYVVRGHVSVRFEKWEGLGNDFLLVEEPVDPARVRRLCDRRLGVGADGVLVIERLADRRARMTVLNADGSRPEMCGNGLRCVAAYVLAGDGDIDILTDAGERRCSVERSRNGGYRVVAGMGRAQVDAAFSGPGGRRFVRVDVGNPHAVSFEPFEDGDLERIGPELERSVPGGINVELCRVRRDCIEVMVWERGVGPTLACGTGACAAAAAAAREGLSTYDAPVVVALPGGDLSIVVGREDGALEMTGPARFVFRGEW